jgi:hypothetical protein
VIAGVLPMTVISIQSQVAFGHVGNSAAVFPMQMHGIDVIAVPTTRLGDRPGYPPIRASGRPAVATPPAPSSSFAPRHPGSSVRKRELLIARRALAII